MGMKMTTDIEQALTEALDHWWNWNEEDDRPRTHHAPVVDVSPAAVAASLMRRPSMQAIARDAAVGRAVREHYEATEGSIADTVEGCRAVIAAALKDVRRG